MHIRARLMLALIALSVTSCEGNSEEPVQNTSLDELAREYPRIDPGNIAIPPADQLTRPDFDIGRHCLSEEEAGHGSFEQCLEVLGRELIALGGPRE